jgi:hypothetical protein
MLAVLIPAAALAAVGIGTVVPAVFGAQYDDAAPAFVPALAMIVLAPINALAVPASALRLRPQAAVIGAATGAVAFVVTALATIPGHGATGATFAMLAAAAASSIASLLVLPGAVGRRVAIASYAGAALVLTLGFVA